MKLQSFYWTIPFISFAMGYCFLYFRYNQQLITVPEIIGRNIQNASLSLAQAQLNLRLLGEKEDNDLPAGTVISQLPIAGQLTRLNKPVFCVISKRNSETKAPQCIGKSKYDIELISQKDSFKLISFYINCAESTDICIGQIPSSGSELENNTLVVYYAAYKNQEYIFPNLVGKKINDIASFLEENNFKIDIVHAFEPAFGHTCQQCKIIEQRPVGGSIVTQKNCSKIQLLVE